MGLCSSSNSTKEKSQNYLLQTLKDHDGGINCMAVSEDGSVLITGSEDHTARLWAQGINGKCECIGVLSGHVDYINAVLIEDNFVITASADKTIRKWDLMTCECVFIMEGHTSLINRIICTGDFVFSSSYDRTAMCWDLETGECVRVFSGHKRGVYPLIFLPADEEDNAEYLGWDNNATDILLTGSADFTVRSWSFETGKCLQVFKEHEGAITCMITDQPGKILFTGSTDQSIRSWNIKRGERLKVFDGHQASIICLLVVNKMLFTGSSDHTAKAWVTEFGDCTRTFRGHKHTVSSLKCHDGILFTSCGDGVARAFDAKGGALKRSFTGHQFAINCLQISGGKLFTGSHDGNVNIWDIANLKEELEIGGGIKSEESKEAAKTNTEVSEKIDTEENGELNKSDENANNELA